MAKLTLDLDHLVVETFHTAPQKRVRGTVVAAQDTTYCENYTFYDPACCSTHETACPHATCVVMSQCCPTYAATCYYTCAATCTCGVSADCRHTDVC
jgi:hypothetical protein